MSVLITTTVCVDAQKPATQAVIHLNRGDSGTRALRMIPVEGGAAIDMSAVAQAKVMAHPVGGGEDLLISCELGDRYADMVPTAALVGYAGEYAAQLVLLNGGGETVKSMPFTILVHANVYTGDTVEHTSKAITEITWNGSVLTIHLEDGTSVSSPSMSHTHPLASATVDGFMSHELFSQVAELLGRVNQDVRTTASPSFAGLTIGNVVINADGTMTGVRFT